MSVSNQFLPFLRIVDKYMKLYGFDCTLVRNTNDYANYDVSTSSFDSAPQLITIRAMLFDYQRQHDGTQVYKDTLIQAGDKQIFIYPPKALDDYTSITNILPENDRIKIGDDLYRVIAFKEINSNMRDSVLWECYIRK